MLDSAEDQLLAVTTLQQKALALEVEIAVRQRTERELADFVENAMEGLHKIGPDGKIMWANNAELKLLGYLGRPDCTCRLWRSYSPNSQFGECTRKWVVVGTE